MTKPKHAVHMRLAKGSKQHVGRAPTPAEGSVSPGKQRQPAARPTSSDPPSFSFDVVRTAILHILADGRGCPPEKLITVTAPPGYGKSVLLSELHRQYQEHGGHCLWLGMDDGDVTLERLLDHLESRFSPADGAFDMLQVMHSGDAPIERRVESLLRNISLSPSPTILFIDNLSYCRDDSLKAVLDALVFRTPTWFHLVLSSTELLPFNRSRARLEGLLRAIDTNELSLDVEEIRQVLGKELCERIGDSAVVAIYQRSEGWPSAVRLMQIVLKSASDPTQALTRFSGTDEDLSALLNRQLVQDFDPQFRNFLLCLALLPTFDAPLATVATDDPEAATHIERLWKRNIFLIPLDRNRQRYRLHSLFRQYLLGEGRVGLSESLQKEILTRAANWCAQTDRPADAIDYALEAGANDLATKILERVAPVFVRDRGDLSRYVAWVERLHRNEIDGGLETNYWYVWALVFHRRYERARREVGRLLSRLEQARAQGALAEGSAVFLRRIDVIRIVIEIYTDRLADARAHATHWLNTADDHPTDRDGDDSFDVATVACAACVHDVAVGRMDEARRMLRLARSSIVQSGSEYGIGWVAVMAGLIGVHAGDYVTTHQDLRGALSRARASLGEEGGIQASIALLAAKTAVEMGLDDEARELLAFGLQMASSHGLVENVAWGLDAAVKLWSGREDDPLSLGELREIAAGYPERLSLMLSCFIVSRLVRLGRLDEADEEAAHAGLIGSAGDVEKISLDSTPGLRELAMAARIDLSIGWGRMKQASTLIAQDSRGASTAGRMGRLVELALDEAAIALVSHNPAPAVQHLTRAVKLAARRRCVRSFRDRADMIARLVNNTRAKDWIFQVEEERRFFAEICASLPTDVGAALEVIGLADCAMVDTPTARELELLSLVDAGYSNQQLADCLNVSVATVKWHLYNLYAKLRVKNRASALARARALNLLSR